MAGVINTRSLLKTLRKYSAVIFFPTFTASTIYADLAHTRHWKQSLIDARKAAEQLPQ